MSYSKQLKTILTSILIVLIPNTIMSLLAHFTDTDRVLIDIDYFIPLLLLAYGQRTLFVMAFILVSLIDFLALFTQLFPFIRISDLLYLSKFAFISSSSYQLYSVMLILLIAVQSYFFLKKYNVDYNKTLLILFNILILHYAFSQYFTVKKIVTSQIISNINYINDGFIQSYKIDGDAFQKPKALGSTINLFKTLDSHDKVLLIINEAWGVTVNSQVQNDVLSPILNNYAVSDTKQDILSFVGATLAGELRELCRKSPIHFNLKNQLDGFEDCLPNRYKDLGYHTVAVHGAIGFMYDRQYWYPRAGFQQTLFRDQGLNLPNSRCYSFPGNCDSDIANRIVEQFNNNNKLFLYWLTLNTHATYDKRDLKTDLFDCNKYKIDTNTATCRNLKLQKQFFHTLSEMIMHPSFSGTKVIVVGDHEPPLIDSKETVFMTGEVPIIEFEIK